MTWCLTSKLNIGHCDLYVTFSEIWGLIEILFEIQIFAFSNSFIFWEEILRSENDIPLQHNVTLAQIYINPKVLFTVLIGYNLSMSARCLVNSRILHSWYIKHEYYKFFKEFLCRKFKWKFTISPFHLIPDILNWSVKALISSYVTFRFDDVICHFTLSADDVAPQQDPKSQRTSNILWSSDFALYLEDCLMYEHHTSGLWVSMTRHLTSK